MVKLRTLLICGTPPTSAREIQEYGVPLSGAASLLMNENRGMHLTHPSLGAVVLATYIRRLGFEVDVRDWYLEEVKAASYEVVGISTTFLDFRDLGDIAQKVRAQNSECKIVVGGQLAWSYPPEEILEKEPAVDVVVCGEGETPFGELLAAMQVGQDLSSVVGIVYRKEGEFVSARVGSQLEAKSIISPDWSLLNLKGRVPLLPVETARGCVYNCAFCSEVTYWGKPVRFREPQVVVEEMERAVRVHGITAFRFADSCFTAPANRCMDVCDNIIRVLVRGGVNVKWSCFARVTDLGERLLDKMTEAGCVAIDIGMESGSEKILSRMNKRYGRADIVKCVSAARANRLHTHCNVIVGFPGETSETVDETIATLNEAIPHTYHIMQLFLAPNTGLSRDHSEYGINGSRLIWRHETMSSDEAAAVLPRIVASVQPSSLFLAGEIAAIMLIASGYSSEDVESFFSRIANGAVGDMERTMMRVFGSPSLQALPN